jgi:hypothetical protein
MFAVCSESHKKKIHCGQNVELLNVKPGDIYSNNGAFKVLRLLTVILEREWKMYIISFIDVLNTAAVKECPAWYRLVAKLKRLCVCVCVCVCVRARTTCINIKTT